MTISEGTPSPPLRPTRTLVRSSAISVGSRLLSSALAFLTLPLTARVLGPAEFGAYATILGLSALVQLADLGLGNALITPLANAIGAGDQAQIGALIAGGRSALLRATIGFASLSAGVAALTDLPSLLGLGSVTGVMPSITAFLVATLLSVPLGLVGAISTAAGQAHQNLLWRVGGSAIGLIATVGCALAGAGLFAFVVAAVGGPLVALTLQSVWWRSHGGPLHKARAASQVTVSMLLRSGLLFFGIQVAGVIAFNTDAVIIARVLGPEAVATYAVPARMFALFINVLVVALMPLWPAFTVALARGDGSWVVSTTKRSLLAASGGALLISTAMVLAIGPLSPILVGDEIAPPPTSLLVALAAWTTVSAAGTAVSMLLHATGQISLQLTCAVVMVAINLPLSVALVREIGVVGATWGTTLAHVGACTIPLGWAAVVTLRRLEQAGAT